MLWLLRNTYLQRNRPEHLPLHSITSHRRSAPDQTNASLDQFKHPHILVLKTKHQWLICHQSCCFRRRRRCTFRSSFNHHRVHPHRHLAVISTALKPHEDPLHILHLSFDLSLMTVLTLTLPLYLDRQAFSRLPLLLPYHTSPGSWASRMRSASSLIG